MEKTTNNAQVVIKAANGVSPNDPELCKSNGEMFVEQVCKNVLAQLKASETRYQMEASPCCAGDFVITATVPCLVPNSMGIQSTCYVLNRALNAHDAWRLGKVTVEETRDCRESGKTTFKRQLKITFHDAESPEQAHRFLRAHYRQLSEDIRRTIFPATGNYIN